MLNEKNTIDPEETTDGLVTKRSGSPASSPRHKRSEEIKNKDSKDKQNLAVYEHYGQHIVPTKEIWVQFSCFGFGGSEPGPEVYDPKTRNRFVLIVFAIVFILILCTAMFNVIVNMVPALLSFFQSKKGFIVFIVCAVAAFMLSLAVCFLDFTYYPPTNYIILFLSLIFMSGITAYFTAISKTSLIIYAIFATMIVVILIMGLACTSWDFTKCWNFVMVGAMAVGAVTIMIYAGMAATKTKIKPLMIGLTALGTFVQSVVLLLVLQSILGGKTVVMAEEFYIIAAYEVYTSIISIFLHILRLLNYVGA